MVYLYNIEDGLKIENTKRKQNIIIIILGILVLLVVTLLTIASKEFYIIIINTLITGSYFSYIFIYNSLIKRNLNSYYHFLAKIQHFDHEIINGIISFIDLNIKTIDNFEVYEIKFNNRTIFIEANKFFDEFKINNSYNLEIVDNFIIGYEVIDDAK